MAIKEQAMHDFMMKAVGDMGAAMSAALVTIGDQLGFYKAMAGHGPQTSGQIAERTGVRERYVREWLLNQAAGGYIEYHADGDAYSMTEEQAAALADEDSPFFIPGAFDVIGAIHRDVPVITDAFRTGDGVPWGAHDACLFCGTERFFGASYRGNLTSAWSPLWTACRRSSKTARSWRTSGAGTASRLS